MPKTAVVMPKMSMTMTEGEVVEITVSIGQQISQGDVVAVVGTDKTDMEVESDFTGTVVEVVASPGAVLEVGSPLLVLETEGEDLLAGMFTPTEPVVAEPPTAALVEEIVVAQPAVAKTEGVLAMPGARKLAAEHGINLSTIVPKSPADVIKQSDLGVDLERAEKARSHIAAVVQSATEIPQFSISGELKLKRALPKNFEARFVVLAKAWVKTLEKHTKLSQQYLSGSFISAETRIAVLVRSPLGFVSPVIGVQDIESEDWPVTASSVLTSARGNKIALANLGGATTAITDLSEFGIRQSNTLLFPPQTSGFNIGAVREKKGKFRVDFTLVVDHRIADPGDAAEAMKTFEKELNGVLIGNG